MAVKHIPTTELGFEEIKQSLKQHFMDLQNQGQFTDYDFDGSGLTLLLDVLAYNTHYNALYTNLAINEAFLDSASKRGSVVSKAKELGYTPRSARSALATITMDFVLPSIPTSVANTLEIPRGTVFTSTKDGVQYTFVTAESVDTVRTGNLYRFTNLALREGINLVNRIVAGPGIQFFIPNPNADISTLRVTVQDTAQSSTFQTYNPSTSLLTIDSTSPVYFIKEIDGGLYEIEFGDGVLGKSLEVGNVVTLDYIVCSGADANGCSTFTYAGPQFANTTTSITTTKIASSGDASESIEMIKWNAPRAFASQNRCVTLDDYKYIILSNYPNAVSVNVWGGEQNVPPSYGDVYISVRPVEGETLSDSEKDYLLNDIIGPRKLVTMHPKFVDPAYIDLIMNVSFYYDPLQTTRSATELSAIVRDTILAYDQDVLNRFSSIYKQSVLSRLIDTSEAGIVSNTITFKARRQLDVVFNRAQQYTINLGNPIYNSGVAEESITTTGFRVIDTQQVCYLEDVPTGTTSGDLKLFYYDLTGKKVILKTAGTVDYSRGIVSLDDIIITDVLNSQLMFDFKLQSQDVVSARNQIVNINSSTLSITPIIDKPADQYRFTSSRN
jgi:hypothetical protein